MILDILLLMLLFVCCVYNLMEAFSSRRKKNVIMHSFVSGMCLNCLIYKMIEFAFSIA